MNLSHAQVREGVCMDMPYRVDLDFVGLGGAATAYGGYLRAWSFREVDGRDWFEEFRQTALAAIGTRFLPVYRMADGEYRFLMGRRVNYHRKPLLKELLAVGAEKLRVKNPDKWKTSWGETYAPKETLSLRKALVEHIRYLASVGYLACYINDNGLHAFVEHNKPLLQYFSSHGIPFGEHNYVPFHFAPSLFITGRWEEFVVGRHILVVTGLDEVKERNIERTLRTLGAGNVQFLPISSTASMREQLDLNQVSGSPELALVAAGIGAANILRQLEPLQTLAVDIGGLMNALVDPSARQHGGVIGLPGRTS